MALAALAPDDTALKASQYRVLELWQQTYEGELLIMLPDTFGTTQFLKTLRTGLPTGPASVSTARIPTSPATNTSHGFLNGDAIRKKSSSLPPTRSTSTTFSAFTLTLAAHFKARRKPKTFRTQPTTSIAKSGYPGAAFVSAPAGARCSPTIFEDAILPAATDSILSVWFAKSPRRMGNRPSSFPTTIRKRWALRWRSNAIGVSSAPMESATYQSSHKAIRGDSVSDSDQNAG